MYGGKKSGLVFFLFILCGVVLGSFIGEFVAPLPYMGWLGFGGSFGLETPLSLELGVIMLQFALLVRINMAGIIGLALALFAYRKL